MAQHFHRGRPDTACTTASDARCIMCHANYPPCTFNFDPDDDVRSFSMNVRLVAANTLAPRTCTLHAEASRAAPGEGDNSGRF
jgi:hypothetical protein